MADNGDVDFSHSFTDLMTSLAIAFLILAVAMIVINIVNQRQIINEAQKIDQRNKEIGAYKNELAKKIAQIFKMIQVEQLNSYKSECVELDFAEQYRLVIRFKGDTKECKTKGLFFGENSFVFEGNPYAIKGIAEIYRTICEEISRVVGGNEPKDYVERVQILGHTDAVMKNTGAECKGLPDGEKLQCGNLYLSAQRARTVFLLIGENLSSNEKDFKCFREKTQISGRGPFDQINNDINKNGLNRRVEVVIDLRVPIFPSDSVDTK